MGSVYHVNGNEVIHESWSLSRDGQVQFPPIEFDFTPPGATAKHEIPLPMPAAVSAGEYELSLKATYKGQTITKEFQFKVQ